MGPSKARDGSAAQARAVSAALGTPTITGLHDFVIDEVVARYAAKGTRVVDLGAGMGADVVAVDNNRADFRAELPFRELELNNAEFAAQLGAGAFSLVTAVEVIEHVESPIGFLRNVRQLLSPDGVAVLTTPNLDSLPARVGFLLTGKLRMMDEHGDRTHVSPIFWDLVSRQFLPRVGLSVVEHCHFPPRGYKNTRAWYAWAFRGLAALAGGACLYGDCHVWVLRAASAPTIREKQPAEA